MRTAKKSIKNILLCCSLAAGIALILSHPPQGLSHSGLRCLGAAVICFSLWVLRPIPLAATSLLAVVLLPALGILEGTRAFSFFGNSAVFFLLGVFIISGAIIRTGLSKRIAFLFLNKYGRSARGILFGVTFSCALFALIMPEHAVAAMMYPVVLEIATALRLERGRSNLGKSLFLALAWGAVAGGVGTHLGGARVPLAVELLHETYGVGIPFVTWAAAALPLVVALTAIIYALLLRFYPSELDDVSDAGRFLAAELRRIGRITPKELIIACIAVTAIAAWIVVGHNVGLAEIAVVAAVAVFVTGAAQWNDLVDYIDWGVIVMYGGAIALGKALAETGAVEWLVATALDGGTLPPVLLLCLLSALAIIITEAISNAAAVVILLPISFGFVAQSGIPAELFTLTVTIPTGLAFCLPMGTPPNAIAYSSGYFSIRDSLLLGSLLKGIAWCIFIALALLYWPLLGITE